MSHESDWIDISVPVHPGIVHWPGDPPVQITRVKDLDRGDSATVSRLDLGAHTGTHMDAPLHFIVGGASIDSVPPAATIGPARVIGIDDAVAVRRADVEAHDIAPGERILFRTRNSRRSWHSEPFDEGFVYIDREAAALLAERGVRAVGIDYLSVGGFSQDAVETHVALLGAGIWVIEGLDLSAVEPGDYELVCLPLRLPGAEGSPARAVLQRLDDSHTGGRLR